MQKHRTIRAALVASAALGLAVLSPAAAMANTGIDYTVQANSGDFVNPAPGLSGRYYSGSGTIAFTSSLTNGVYGLADIATFSLNLQLAIQLANPPGSPYLTADYEFSKSDLSAFSITMVGGVATAASWTLNPVASYQHSSSVFDPAAQSVDFQSGSDNGISFYVWPSGVKTLTATGDIEATFGEVAAGVPEPASWALMIGGFGLMGCALRRRSPTPRTAAA